MSARPSAPWSRLCAGEDLRRMRTRGESRWTGTPDTARGPLAVHRTRGQDSRFVLVGVRGTFHRTITPHLGSHACSFASPLALRARRAWSRASTDWPLLLRCTPLGWARCSEHGIEAPGWWVFRVPFRRAPRGKPERNGWEARNGSRSDPCGWPRVPGGGRTRRELSAAASPAGCAGSVRCARAARALRRGAGC
jgi:hypothetical protein